jgi:hypothetical protein
MPNVSIDAMKIMSDDARYFIVWANIKKILFGLVFGASMQTP